MAKKFEAAAKEQREEPPNESEEDSDVAPMPSIVDNKPTKTAEEKRMEEIVKATESARIAAIEHESKVGEDTNK